MKDITTYITEKHFKDDNDYYWAYDFVVKVGKKVVDEILHKDKEITKETFDSVVSDAFDEGMLRYERKHPEIINDDEDYEWSDKIKKDAMEEIGYYITDELGIKVVG